jgi:hypothetical protein
MHHSTACLGQEPVMFPNHVAARETCASMLLFCHMTDD